MRVGPQRRLSTEESVLNTFKFKCWRRLLRLTQTARRSNQSILKEIKSEYSLEGLMLKLKLQYFGQLIGKDPDAGKGKRRRGKQRMRWLDSITNLMDMNLSKFHEIVKDRKAWHAAVQGLQKVGHDLANEQQQQYLYR